MADRTRPIRIEFCVTEQEKKLIQHKMAQLGTHNMGAYLRKMAIDGYIIKVDYTEQKKLAAAVSRVAGNINQICRRINQTGHFYEDDIVELKVKQCEIWTKNYEIIIYRDIVVGIDGNGCLCAGNKKDIYSGAAGDDRFV